MDSDEESEAASIQEIKVKWNNFIKMRKGDYLDDYEIIR